jgi:hypothetical protein
MGRDCTPPSVNGLPAGRQSRCTPFSDPFSGDAYCGWEGETKPGAERTDLRVVGAHVVEGNQHGNVSVGGGWGWRVESVSDTNGWPAGWCGSLTGLKAFLDAVEYEPDADTDNFLGPVDSPSDPHCSYAAALRGLADRMLATLVIVSQIALDQNPQAAANLERQRLEFLERSLKEW